MIGWTAVIFAIQGWLAETPAQAASATTPSYLQVGMAAMSLGVVSEFVPWQFLLLLCGGFGFGELLKRNSLLTRDDLRYRHTCPFSCLLPWVARLRLVLRRRLLRRVSRVRVIFSQRLAMALGGFMCR